MVRPGDPVGGSAARQIAKQELDKSEYHHDRPSMPTRILHWIGRRLDDLFSGSGGSHALLLLLVVVLAVVIVFAVRAGTPRRAVRGPRDPGADPLAPVAARDHRRLAMQFTAEGRRADAVREWLRAAVQSIEERGVLVPRPGRTGAATAREAGPLLPAAAGDLATATRAFDEVWFGGREATDADVEAARAAADGAASARIAPAAPGAGITAPW